MGVEIGATLKSAQFVERIFGQNGLAHMGERPECWAVPQLQTQRQQWAGISEVATSSRGRKVRM